LIFGLIGIFVPLYFQSKNLKRNEILKALKREHIKFSPYLSEQNKRRKEISGIKGPELLSRVENELESYVKRRAENDLTKYELKHERSLKRLLSKYKNA